MSRGSISRLHLAEPSGYLDQLLALAKTANDREAQGSIQHTRSLLLLGIEQFDRSLEAIEDALSSDLPHESEVRAREHRASLLHMAGDHKGVLDEYRRIKTLTHMNTELRRYIDGRSLAKIVALLRLGRPQAAFAQLQAAERGLDDDGNEGERQVLAALRGLVTIELGKPEEAIEGLLMSSKVYPGWSPIWEYLAVAYASLDRWDESLDALKAAVSTDETLPRRAPTDPRFAVLREHDPHAFTRVLEGR